MESKIIFSKAFYKKAANPQNRECDEIMQLRKDFPEYSFELKEIARAKRKTTYGKLTYENMKKYIIFKEGEQAMNLTVLEDNIGVATTTKSSYVHVKKWFLDNYPDYKNSALFFNKSNDETKNNGAAEQSDDSLEEVA